MPRPRLLDPSTRVDLAIPTTMKARVDLHLFSEAAGRVPHGAHKEFFMTLLTSYFNNEVLELAPYLGETLEGFWRVSGHPEVIKRLKEVLDGK